jgi:hypothetical protein
MYAADELLDYYIYDKNNFYSQNERNYLKQERTQVKQSIYQSIMSQELDKDTDLKKTLLNEQVDTFESAFRSMIMKEELLDYS